MAMMITNVYKAKIHKNIIREKIYESENISDQVVLPIINIQRLDLTLDTSEIKLLNDSKSPLKERTRMAIELFDEDTKKKIIHYRIVEEDEVECVRYGDNKRYLHNVKLIEISKLLERYFAPNTTITNYLYFLYNSGVPLGTKCTPAIKKLLSEQSPQLPIPSNLYSVASESATQYISTVYIKNTTISVYDYIKTIIVGYHGWEYDGSPVHQVADRNINARFAGTTIISPNGESTRVAATYTFNQVGTYTIKQNYISDNRVYIQFAPSMAVSGIISLEYTYEVKVYEEAPEQVPTRHSVYDVVSVILEKVHGENSVHYIMDERLQDFQGVTFKIDEDIANRLKETLSPEFTFSDNTLWGMLEQVGNYLHAIPYLKPKRKLDEEGIEVVHFDDWNIISFQFLGENETQMAHNEIMETSIRTLDNSATAFVSKVENSFQTNNAEYISITEPFSNGYISARTISDDFEVSNDNVVFKTTRPIQRITSLWVKVYNENIKVTDKTKYIILHGSQHTAEIDISRFVREKADYDIMLAYPQNQSQFDGLGTKSTTIYYTRGSNLIEGLTYTKPTHISIESLLYFYSALSNIINIMIGARFGYKDYTYSDIMYRVKYVPFFDLTLMQYKTYVDDESGENTLYYNQNESQVVDIESLGENTKSALLMTGNEEPQKTIITRNMNYLMESGQKDGDYYAYQVNEEISSNYIKQTTTYHKNFNKWNDYVAIKKNYREWEVSEKECYVTNPCYNEFCIITDTPDSYDSYLAEDLEVVNQTGIYGRGFHSEPFLKGLMFKLTKDNWYKSYGSTIEWAKIRFVSKEWNNGVEQEVAQTFLCPTTAFSYGNSIVININADDSYSFKNYVKPNGSYGVEYYSPYGNVYGEVERIAFLELGGGSIFDTSTYNIQKQMSKDLYGNYTEDIENTLEMSLFQIGEETTNDRGLIINKDSRQAFNLTLQLHFVTDNEKIRIGKALAQLWYCIGNTDNTQLRAVLFAEKPNLFLSNVNPNTWVELSTIPTYQLNTLVGQITIKGVEYKKEDTQDEMVGFGLINKDNEVVLYYEYLIPRMDEGTLPNLYLKFRKRI